LLMNNVSFEKMNKAKDAAAADGGAAEEDRGLKKFLVNYQTEGMVVPSAGAKPWREKKEWRITPCPMARVLAMAHHSMVRAKASRLWLTTPLNSGAIPNLVPNSIFLTFFSMARAYGTTTPSALRLLQLEASPIDSMVDFFINNKQRYPRVAAGVNFSHVVARRYIYLWGNGGL
ncbi:hypothetical protein Tco_0985111, partial [Tanacetum coccineum]